MVRSPEEKAHRLAAYRRKATTRYFPASEIRPPPPHTPQNILPEAKIVKFRQETQRREKIS
jgi:hypothetical protein